MRKKKEAIVEEAEVVEVAAPVEEPQRFVSEDFGREDLNELGRAVNKLIKGCNCK
jgi:hypothetical protein